MPPNRTTGDAMSLLDQVGELEQQIVERLQELEPLIGEYNQLRQLAQRLGVSYTPAEEDTATRATSARRKSAAKKSNRAKRTATRSGDNPKTAAKATPPTGTPAKATAPRTRGRKAASTRPGQRTEDVLRAVGAQPGISVREIGERLGVDATSLYRVT